MTSASAQGQPQGTTVPADDGCCLWTAETGHGPPLIMCHGGPGLWDWFGINQDCFSAIWGELRRTWHEAELIDACRSFGVPVLIIDGSADLRPRSAVDSLAGALPNHTRVVLPGAGHVPWLEVPAEFAGHVLDFLRVA